MVPISKEQETALQIVQTSNRIATPEQLAVVLKTEPRYYTLDSGIRLQWLGQQILSLNYMIHSQKIPNDYDLFIESSLLDQGIMEEEGLRSLTQIEMQDAFRRGISREYGDFYGITVSSLIGFLRGFKNCPKRMAAIAMLYKEERKKMTDEEKLFWKTIKEARDSGLVDIPSFQHSPFEGDKQHLERIRKQREEILKQLNKDA